MKPILLGVVAAVVVLAAAAAWVRRATRHAARRLQAALQGQAPVMQERGNSFGRRSAGVTQVRGTGYLAVTHRDLIFAQWVPAATLTISLADVTGVDVAAAHLGKRRRPLLRVDFTLPEGGADQIAFEVFDAPRWVEQLRELIATLDL